MSTSTVFTNNRSQAVRLPADMRFPDSVKKVEVRVVGLERNIAQAESAWDSFFLAGQTFSNDFMTERADQLQSERDSLLGYVIQMLKYLLDTNIVIYVIKQRPIEVLTMFNKQSSYMAYFVRH